MSKRIGYLVNVYPKVSHAFIRREILALESLGHEVRRYTLRSSPETLVDPADVAELAKTTVILDSKFAVIVSLCLSMLRPSVFLRSLRTALSLWSGGVNSFIKQLIYLAEGAHLARLCRRDGVSHLHAHFGTNPAAVALLTHKLGGPPYSFTVHGPDEFDAPVALRLREKIAGAKFVVAISHFCRSQLMRWADIADWPKIQIVRCGVDESFLAEPLTPPPDNNVFLCVARLSEQKGLPVLIDAVAQLKAAGTHIRVKLVGDGPLRPMLESRVRTENLQDHIEFLGNRTSSEIRELLKSSRAFVLPSFAEGLPVVLMEAMALGRPAITTYIAGIPELVRHSVNGWVVPAGVTLLLADAITECLGCSMEQLRHMGSAGAEAVARQHNVKNESRLLAGRYRDVALVLD